MAVLSELEHENLSNKVYATLCDALIAGHFKPDDRLKVRDLAEQLGTSATPVREAILRLMHDDAVVSLSARDIRIPIMTTDKHLEISAIRMRLEALAAEMAAMQATKKDTANMEQLLKENEAALEARDRRRCAELNQAFHFMLPTIARMPILNSIMRRLWLQMGPLIAAAYFEEGRAMINHHYPVLEALKRCDPTAAVKAIQNDIMLGEKMLLPKIRANH